MQCSVLSFFMAIAGSYVGLYVAGVILIVIQGVQASQFRGEVRDAQDQLLRVKRPGLVKMRDEHQDALDTTLETSDRIKNLFRREVSIMIGVVSVILAVLFLFGACGS